MGYSKRGSNLGGGRGHPPVPTKKPLDRTFSTVAAELSRGELRNTQPELGVVIVTGYPDSPLMKEAPPFASLGLLAKPIEAVSRKRTVRSVIGETLASARSADTRATAFISASNGGD
jgi:hypothetical protein